MLVVPRAAWWQYVLRYRGTGKCRCPALAS